MGTGWRPSSRNFFGSEGRRRQRRLSNDETNHHALGEMDRCWCGKEIGHYWTDQEFGAPHPKEEKDA
jgi:hypothetical protein